jgi:large subunit ribosomal protein L34e
VIIVPKPKDRSRSRRKVAVKVPSGKTKLITKKKIHSDKQRCAICKSVLQATHSDKKMSKSQKRPERKFGGHLCHKCLDKVITYGARLNEGIVAIDDIEIRYRPYVEKIRK